MLKKVTLLLLIISFSLSSCNDPQDANEQNFTKSINKYLADKPATIPLRHLGLDGDFPQFKAYKSSNYKRHSDKISTLKQVGIITTKDTVSEQRLMFGRTKEMSGIKIDLTSKGEKVFVIKRKLFLKEPSLRIADIKVDEILNFTMPKDIPGSGKSVTVKYKPALKNVEPWADQIRSLDRYKSEKKIRLQLTNNGWVHHTDI